jgi:hypothetical protein
MGAVASHYVTFHDLTRRNRGFDFISDVLPFGGLWYAEMRAVMGASRFRVIDSNVRARDYVFRVRRWPDVEVYLRIFATNAVAVSVH